MVGTAFLTGGQGHLTRWCGINELVGGGEACQDDQYRQSPGAHEVFDALPGSAHGRELEHELDFTQNLSYMI